MTSSASGHSTQDEKAGSMLTAERLRVVIELGRQVGSIRSLDELLAEACRLIAEAFGYDIVGVSLVDPLDERRLYPASAYPPAWTLPKSFRVPIGKGLTGWVAATGEVRLANDVRDDPLYIAGPGRRTRAELDLPLKAGDRTIGVLNVESERPNAFRADDVPFLEVVAILLAQAITAARLAAHEREAATIRERARVARELHDETVQALVAIGRQLDLLQMDQDSGREVPPRIELLHQLVERTLDGVRRLSRNLRPAVLEDLGLVPALQAFVDELRTLGLQVHFELLGDPYRLSPGVEDAVYRIALETLHNVLHHASVPEAHVRLTFGEDDLTLEVTDVGAGFDVVHALELTDHQGLRSMRDRATEIGGELQIRSTTGEGTAVRLAVPARLILVDRL
ncbi:MAG: hypothetical protein QOF51_284 [Chloroflexota bacterium]|jgi:signal transduction histidine kinase|nr:hypothetical protein [Chloroflexota bacterium]